MLCELHGINRELDVHVAFDFATAGGLESLCSKTPATASRGLELLQQALVIDVEAQGLRGGVEIGPIDEERDLITSEGILLSRKYS